MADDETTTLVLFARRYIDGVSAWRAQEFEEGGGFAIYVADLSGRAGDFAWAGEQANLTEELAAGLIARIDAFVEGGGRVSLARFGRSIRPRLRPDGSWVFPMPQG